MKRRIRQGVAAMVAATVLSTAVAPSAAADYRRDQMPMDKCRPAPPTPEGELVNAWHLQRLGMNEVWRFATGEGVKVAVIDTGVSVLGTPYLDPTRITAYNYLTQMSEQDFSEGLNCTHGTGVVSLIAAGRGPDGPIHPATDFAGIAPESEIIAYRTLYDQESAQDMESILPMIMAIDDAVAQGVDVINISQVVDASDPFITQLQQAVARAINAGVVVVAAAGNADSPLGGPAYPASFEGVISVGASNKHETGDAKSWAQGPITIGAPGDELIFLAPSRNRANAGPANQAFNMTSPGSSFSAAIVSGVVALMIDVDRQRNGEDSRMTPAEVKQRLIDTADPPGSRVPDRRIGYGIVNPLAALTGPAPAAAATTAAEPVYPTPFQPKERDDVVPMQMGIGIAVGAVSLVAMGLVAAIAIPAAVRRRK